MRNETNTISMFATRNPTDKWVVAINGFFTFANSEVEADDIYYGAVGKDEDIENSPFGSIAVIPPHHEPTFINGYVPDGGIVDVTTRRPIDLIGFIRKAKSRKSLKDDDLGKTTPAQRLADLRLMAGIFNMHWRDYYKSAPIL